MQAMQVFSPPQTEEALPLDALVEALRRRFSQGAECPPRHVHELVGPAGRRMTSLIMPAWLPGQLYGVKIVNIAPGNTGEGLPGLHGSYLLFDARTGVPLACLDGTVLTARRTAATAALAASFLASPDASHLLVVGAGAIAALLPAAFRAVRPSLRQVSVWARRPEAAQALAARWRHEGWEAQAVTDLAAACARAQIVSCATLATEPLLRGEWLAPGTHLDLIGSFTPAMREADDACIAGARLFVDTEEALLKSGDLIGPRQSGALRDNDLRGTLTTLCRGVATGRRHAQDRTVFKSVGTALADLAAAELAWGHRT